MPDGETLKKISIVPGEDRRVTAHEPRAFVMEDCFENCGNLCAAAGQAALDSIKYPAIQTDIVCLGKRFKKCGARVIDSGMYKSSSEVEITGSDEYFREAPGLDVNGDTAKRLVQKAVQAGVRLYNVSDIS